MTSYDDGQLQLAAPDILELDENFTDFEILQKDGNWIAIDEFFRLAVVGNGKICHRRAYVAMGPEAGQRRSALLAEIDGVKLYIRWTDTGYQAVLTTHDLRV